MLQISNPNGLFVFPDGTAFLLDPGNHRIRCVDPEGAMTTVVNDLDPAWFPSGRGLWVSPERDLIYYTNELAPVPPAILTDGAVVKKWTPSGGIEIVCDKATGFVNPGNLAVNPIDGLLYVTDRAEDDDADLATGLWRIDGPNTRTRITGNITQPVAADGQLANASFIEQTRGIAFLPDGSYFICGHRDGSIWHVDAAGVLHRYMRGAGRRDGYSLGSGQHPPLLAQEYFSQPRAISIAPNGDLIGVSNDSGFVFVVNNVAARPLPRDVRPALLDAAGLRLTWTAVFGRGCVIERATNLAPANWQIIRAAASASNGPLDFTNAEAASQTRAFYRLSGPRPNVADGADGAAGVVAASARKERRPARRRPKPPRAASDFPGR